MSSIPLRRGLLALVALTVAAILIPPFINVGRFQGRVAASMSRALGRPVTCDAIELRLFPQPGFQLTNVSIGDDPAYSTEPILHAEVVTANIGISSLWLGRMEISSLHFDYPNLNLVERADGSWNLEALLWKASRTQAGPTAERSSSQRTRFPYIEASNGRIDYKYGLEKSAFSLSDADFTLYSPGENQWRMRIEAKPVRTDLPITDTGTLKAELTVTRAAQLRDAPVKGTVTWQRAQLGNLSRLFFGTDSGWRGTLEASAKLDGTLGTLRFATASKLEDFRRYDINSATSLNLSATCTGELSLGLSQLHQTRCLLPLDGGQLSVQGNLQGLHDAHYDLALKANAVGARALLDLTRRSRSDLPDDLVADGTLSGDFHISRNDEAAATWMGSLLLSNFSLNSAELGHRALVVPRITASIDTAAPHKSGKSAHENSTPQRALRIDNFELPLGAAHPSLVQGSLDANGINLHLKGDGTVERLQQFARAIGIAAPKISLSGAAALDLNFGGAWSELNAPIVSGQALLHGVRAEVPGLAQPVLIAGAHVAFDRDRFQLSNATAAIGPVTLYGQASFLRSCPREDGCSASFDLTTDELNVDQWNQLLNPRLRKRPWYRLLGSTREHNVFPRLHATGRLAARRLLLGDVAGTNFATNFTVTDGVVELSNAQADLFGGQVAGTWTVNLAGNQPVLNGQGRLTHLAAERIGAQLGYLLGAGAISGDYSAQLSGATQAELLKSANGRANFTWTGGALGLVSGGKMPLRIAGGAGQLTLNNAGWMLNTSRWKTAAGTVTLRGSINRNAQFAVEVASAKGVTIRQSGTLSKSSAAAIHRSSNSTPATKSKRR